MYMYVCIYTYIYVYRLFCASCFGVGIPHRVLQLCEIPTAVSMCDVLSRVKSYATAWAYTFERFAYTSAGVKAGRICIYICLHVICNICSVTYFLDRQVDLTQSAINDLVNDLFRELAQGSVSWPELPMLWCSGCLNMKPCKICSSSFPRQLWCQVRRQSRESAD